jgi:hypothetical protein
MTPTSDPSETRIRINKWRAFAALNPEEFARYWGGCSCYGCDSYRQRFADWSERNRATQTEEPTNAK